MSFGVPLVKAKVLPFTNSAGVSSPLCFTSSGL